MHVIIRVCVIALLLLALLARSRRKPIIDQPDVYCLMVTLNDPRRQEYIRQSVRNFREQTYVNKRLVIMNQSESGERILASKEDLADDRMLEVMLPRGNLGEIRNISLEMVPLGAIWTLWDDDDWRAPDYLEILEKTMRENDADFLMIRNRIEYVVPTKFAYVATLRSGFMSFFARKTPRPLRYAHLDRLEDKPLKIEARRTRAVYVLDNPPTMYVRFVHDTNTSPYVNNKRASVRDTSRNSDYFEREIHAREHESLRKILSNY
jgi:glycosyltransferase involved in cell wall biosynthesis